MEETGKFCTGYTQDRPARTVSFSYSQVNASDVVSDRLS